ncbi:MAG: major capsid protein [Ramlibacter sp.]
MKQALKLRLAVIPALMLAAGQSAFAAVPEGVTTELTTAKTDVTTIGVAVFAVIVAIAIFKWFRRAL